MEAAHRPPSLPCRLRSGARGGRGAKGFGGGGDGFDCRRLRSRHHPSPAGAYLPGGRSLLLVLLLAISLRAEHSSQGIPDEQQIGPPTIPEPLPPFEMRPSFPQEPQTFIAPVHEADIRPGFRCFTLNTAATLMEPGGYGGFSPKPFINLGFHAAQTIETQILLHPTSVYYLPLPRVPRNDGCAYQAAFGASPPSGCQLTGVPFAPLPSGGFSLGEPFSNNSHCQLFSSCVPYALWQSDPRHLADPGSQGQWCAELGGCYQPATGVKTNNGCLCYSDRPLREWYGSNVSHVPLPPKLDGHLCWNCTMGWVRLLGGTRCGFTSYGRLNQRPRGRSIRDKGEGKVDNPALLNQGLSKVASEAVEQDSASFVFRRHPSCIEYNQTSRDAGTIRNIQPSQGMCMYEGQVQLAARVMSNGDEGTYSVFDTPLNHSVIYTLRIWPEERASLFELISADGTSVMEARRLPHRRCFNFKQGRNLGLSRLPLPGANNLLNRICTYTTPISVCYASDPQQWGTDAWKRTAGQGVADDAFNSGIFASPAGARCEPPMCTPHSGGGVLSPPHEQFRYPAGG